MKIQCDVCEKAATVVCCADEAALCASCDVEVHAANKLASKHQRIMLQSIPNKLPRCDICQEKAAFIFCVEDRALFCQECDESIHIAGTLTGNHQRFLATGIQVALSSMCRKPSDNVHSNPSNHKPQPSVPLPKGTASAQLPSVSAPFVQSPWAVDELLQLSDYESADKKESQLGFEELEWFSDIGLFSEQDAKRAMAAAEVPELIPVSAAVNVNFHRPARSDNIYKKPRIQTSGDDNEEDFFLVPDLG